MKFFHFVTKSYKEQSFPLLEEKLRQLSKLAVPKVSKDEIKKRLLYALNSEKSKEASKEKYYEEIYFATLIEKIKSIARQLIPREFFRLMLRERLIAITAFQKHQPFFKVRAIRRTFAFVLVFVFVSTVIFDFTFRIEKVQASYQTVLEEINGEVSIIRDSEEFSAKPKFLLKANDTIRTGKSSRAVIRFLDESVSRLDENTEVSISKLFVNPLNKTETIVELVVLRGQLWTRVINLINDFSRFQVKAENAVATAKKKAAFNVSVSPKRKATVSAVQHRVDLAVATEKKVVDTTLMKGFRADITPELSAVSTIQSDNGLSEEKDQWVSENLVRDHVYIENVKQAAEDKVREQVKVSPTNPLYIVKELSEKTQIALTFNEFERQKKILFTVQEKFAQAYVFLIKGQLDKAEAVLREFQVQIQTVFQWIKDYEPSHPVQAQELRLKIIELLNEYQKYLVLVLPNDPLYRAKEAVAKTQILFVDDPGEKTHKQFIQAEAKLFEALDLLEKGDTSRAKEQLQAYTKAVSEVILEVKQLQNPAKEKAITAILDNRLEDLKVLQTISSPGSIYTTQGTSTTVRSAGTTTSAEMISLQSLTNLSGSSSFMFNPSYLQSMGTSTGTSTGMLTVGTSVSPATLAKSLDAEFQKTLTEAKTDILTKFGEAMLEVQKTQSSAEVLKKLQDVKTIDVNGKPFVNMQLLRDKVMIKSDGAFISVVGTTTSISGTSSPISLPTADSGIRGLPLAPP